MIELNLLPDVKQEFVRAQRLKRVIISSMVLILAASVAVVVLLAIYVLAGQPLRKSLATQDIDQKAKELKNNKNLTRNLTLQAQLESLDQLHDQKNDLSRWLDFLTALNPAEPNNARLSNISIDTSTNSISFDANVRDYKAIAILVDTFRHARVSYTDPEGVSQKKDLFKVVVMSQPSAGKDPTTGAQTGSAKFIIEYEPEVLLWSVKNPVVSVPIEDTTPSANKVSIFTEEPTTTTQEGQ